VLHDGPVWKARVYVDVNRNHQADDGDVLIDPQTDRFGNYEGEIPERYRGYPLVANNENAVHLKGDGSVNEDGTPAESSQPLPRYLGTPAGATVISPLTHIISLWPSMDDPLRQSIQSNPLFNGYDPLQDNIFALGVDVTYEALIKEFLIDLTGLIIKYRYRVDLKDAASNLLREYANRVKEPLVLTFVSVEVHGTKIAENSETGTSLFTAGATVRVVDGTQKQPNLAWGLVTKSGQALPGWLADLVTIDPATGIVSLKSMPDFEALKTRDGVRVDEAKGELSLDVTVRVTATDGGRTLWRDKTFMLTITDVNEPPKFIAHSLSPLTMTENQLMKEDESLLVVRIGGLPEGFAGLQVTDPDAGDDVTLRLAGGKDAALFELVQLDDGRFALMWKAGADGRRQAPSFERTHDNNFRLSHDDDGIFVVDIIARDSGGNEATHSVRVAILDDLTELPLVQAVRAASQTGPIKGLNYTKPRTSGDVYFNGEDPSQPLTLSVRFGDGPAASMLIQLDPVLSDKNYRIGETVLSYPQFLRLPKSFQQRAVEYKGALYEISDAMPPGGYVFDGHYGKITISSHRMPENLNRLKWVYEVYADYGSGSPFNQIGPGATATETITFVVGEGGRQATHTISLDLVGNHDRPVIVSETAVSGASGGFQPDVHARPWAWWQDKFIIQEAGKDRTEQKSVFLKPGLETSVWRFLTVDEDGAYFRSRDDSSGNSDYGPVAAFTRKYLHLTGRDSNMFEIIQATDESGAPRFVPLPGDETKLIPVLELHFKSAADKVPGQTYLVRLQVLDDLGSVFAGEGIRIDLSISVQPDLRDDEGVQPASARSHMVMPPADDAPTWQPTEEMPPLQAELI